MLMWTLVLPRLIIKEIFFPKIINLLHVIYCLKNIVLIMWYWKILVQLVNSNLIREKSINLTVIYLKHNIWKISEIGG